MNINGINKPGHSAYPMHHAVNENKKPVDENKTPVNAEAPQQIVRKDTYVPSTPVKNEESYTLPQKLTNEQVDALKRQIYDSMRSMVQQMLGVQVGIAGGKDLNVGAMTDEELAKALGIGTTPETAAEAISENGMWGVDAVATRLMDMAMALSNGDPSKAEELRQAVKDGFKAVGDMESLPQVCQDTYAETMKRFDYWVEHGNLEGYGQNTDAKE